MKKQTAVEWLKLQLETYGDPQYCELTWIELDELCEQAKAMEREQIEQAYGHGHNDGCAYTPNCKIEFKNSKYYYNETYKGGEQ